MSKDSGRIISLTQNQISLLNRLVFAPEVNKLLEDFRIFSGYEDKRITDDTDLYLPYKKL